MAVHSFGFESAGEDAEKFVRESAPKTVLTTVQQAIAFLSMRFRNPLPPSVAAEVERMTADEVIWLDRVVQGSTDPTAAMEQLAEKLGEGLDIENLPSGDFTDGARLSLRNALFACWVGLPEGRRNSAEAGRIVRLAISRQIELQRDIEREFSEE